MFGRGRKRERREPRMGGADESPGDLRASREDRPARSPRRKGRRRRSGGSRLGKLAYWGVVGSIWAAIGFGGLVAYHFAQLPPIDQLAVPKRPPNIAILAADGSLMANRGDTGGAAVSLKELPAYAPKAFVAIEDRRFYSHWGVDPIGIGRAIVNNVAHRGANMQGGSTITQQLAKNLFLTQERTVSRKIQEAILALWLERKFSKDQILELYLNRVYFGSGAYGVEAAARKYYGKSARQLTLAESAVLAGLMKAPTKLAPNRNPDAAADRATQVIAAMAQEGHITEAMAKLALSRPAEIAREAGAGSVNYAADYVMDVLDETVGAIESDIIVTTTIQPRLQTAAEAALTAELDAKGSKLGVSQGALVAMDPNGAIRALVGGRTYADSQFNRAVSAKRQPGSAFKPFVYLAALEAGLTPETQRADAPINVKGWKPENYSRDYYGNVTLTQALAMSLNTVAVRLGLEVGPRAVSKVAHRLGIGSELKANASLALGTSEVTPLELVTAYAPFANGGLGVQPHVIARVRTVDGKQLYARKGASLGRLVEPHHVAMMNQMMQETLLTGTARKAELPGWQAAGKTGTSQDFRDAWFIGYTSALVAGVWLGNDDSSPTKKVSGGNMPVEVWSRFMKQAMQGVPVAALPGGAWRAPTPAATSGPAISTAPAPMPDLAARDQGGGGGTAPLPPARLSAAPQPAPAAPTPAPRPAAPIELPGARAAPTPPQPIGARPLPPAEIGRAAAARPVEAPGAGPQRRADGAPVPPGAIPGRGDEAARGPRERGFVERLFGGG